MLPSLPKGPDIRVVVEEMIKWQLSTHDVHEAAAKVTIREMAFVGEQVLTKTMKASARVRKKLFTSIHQLMVR